MHKDTAENVVKIILKIIYRFYDKGTVIASHLQVTHRTEGFHGTQFEHCWYWHAVVKLQIEVVRRCHAGTL